MNGNNSGMSLPAANLAVVANALEIGTQAIMRVAGQDIANTVNGEAITPAFIQETIAVRMRTALETK